LASEAIALYLLGVGLAEQQFAFLLSAYGFVVYRAFIEQKSEEENYLKKEMRRWWLRQEPENTFSFALIGGLLLTGFNFELWQQIKPIEVWVMCFVSIGLTQIVFEQARSVWNRVYVYLLVKLKERKYAEVKRLGFGKNGNKVSG